MRELWSGVLHTSAAKIYSLGTGILVLFITARILGAEGRGQVAAITTWVGLFSTFAFLSLGQVALHQMAKDPGHRRFGALLGSLAALAIVLTLLAWLVALGLYLLRPDTVFKGLPAFALFLGFIALPFLIWEQYGSALLAGLERIQVYNRWEVIGRTVTVVGVVVLVGLLGQGVPGVLEASFLGQVIVALGGVGVLLRYAREKSPSVRADAAQVRDLLAGGAKLHLNAIGTFLITSANVLILNHYGNPSDVGCFQLASQLVALMMIVPQAASTMMFGKVATLGSDQAWPQNRRMLLQLTVVMLAAAAVAAAAAPWAIPAVAGPTFVPAVAPFQWMLLGLVGLTFSAVMAPQWIGRGYFWQSAVLTAVVGVLNLAANFWLIPRQGLDGAVVAFVATYLFSILGNGAMAWHCELQYRRSRAAPVGAVPS